MFLRIENTREKKLIGQRISSSFADDKTFELWRKFMPRRKEILNRLGEDLLAMQRYPPAFDFQPSTIFEKWATVEVADFEHIPEEMEGYVLVGGLYAVFFLKGHSHQIFEDIHTKWLPNSEYELDDREHFEILGQKYHRNDPNSEEEIWIPIRIRN